MQKIGKEVKIGLAVIGVLLAAFGYVFYKRLAQPEEAVAANNAAAANSAAAGDSAEHATVVHPTDTGRPADAPADGKRSLFSLDSARHLDPPEAKSGEPTPAGPRDSFMPPPATASDAPENRFGGYGHNDKAAPAADPSGPPSGASRFGGAATAGDAPAGPPVNPIRRDPFAHTSDNDAPHATDGAHAGDDSPLTPSGDPFQHRHEPASGPVATTGPDVTSGPPAPLASENPKSPSAEHGHATVTDDGTRHRFEPVAQPTSGTEQEPSSRFGRAGVGQSERPTVVADDAGSTPHRFGPPPTTTDQPAPPAYSPPQGYPPSQASAPGSQPAALLPGIGSDSGVVGQVTVDGPANKPSQYVVQPNDNFWTISEKAYGTGGYFKAIYEYNRRQHPRPERLQVGETLEVPDQSVLQKNYPDLCPKPSHTAAAVPGRVTPASARMRPGTRVYVVEEGDTLFEIARRELGKPSRWGEIYQLNRESLGSDFDYLRPGSELLLPGDARPDVMARQPSGTLSR